MDLIRDILDAQLVDELGRNIGRVDGIIVEVRDGRPPRFVAMEVGIVTLLRRLHPRLGRWARAFAVRFSPVPLRRVRIPPHTFRDIGVDVEVAVYASGDPQLLRLEKWLSRHVVARLPGGSSGLK